MNSVAAVGSPVLFSASNLPPQVSLQKRVCQAIITPFIYLGQWASTLAFVFKATWIQGNEQRLCTQIQSFADKLLLGRVLSGMPVKAQPKRLELLKETILGASRHQVESSYLSTTLGHFIKAGLDQPIIEPSYFQGRRLETYLMEVLYSAIFNQDLPLLEALAEKGVSLNEPDRFGMTPLALALKENRHKVVNFLIASPHFNVNFSCRPFEGVGCYSPLSEAVGAGSLEAVKLLVKKGATIDTPSASRALGTPIGLPGLDGFRITPLEQAAALDHLDIVQYLKEQGATASPKLIPILIERLSERIGGSTSSHPLTKEVIETYLNLGLREVRDAPLPEGDALLPQWRVEKLKTLVKAATDNPEILQWLLDLGFDPNLPSYGKTPLMGFVNRGAFKTFDLLIALPSIDLSYEGDYEENVLVLVMESTRYLDQSTWDRIDAILEKGGKSAINARAFRIAQSWGNKRLIEKMLSLGFEPPSNAS